MIPRSQAGRIDVLELEAELADVVAETGFDVARLVKATFHELRDACLGRKALHRFDKNIPLRRYVCVGGQTGDVHEALRSEEHTSELQSLMRISYAVFCLKTKKKILHYRSHNMTQQQSNTK